METADKNSPFSVVNVTGSEDINSTQPNTKE